MSSSWVSTWTNLIFRVFASCISRNWTNILENHLKKSIDQTTTKKQLNTDETWRRLGEEWRSSRHSIHNPFRFDDHFNSLHKHLHKTLKAFFDRKFCEEKFFMTKIEFNWIKTSCAWNHRWILLEIFFSVKRRGIKFDSLDYTPHR